jgi:hypothetical protein
MSQVHRVVVVCFSVMALSLMISACTPLEPDGSEAPSPGPHTGQATQAFTGGGRLCSAIDPGAPFRDSIEAGDGWDYLVCARWARSVGAQIAQLGCVFPNDFVWGVSYGSNPNPNSIPNPNIFPNPFCGW